MKIYRLFFTFIILFIFFNVRFTKAQNDEFSRKFFDNWSLNANFGISQYHGDVSGGTNPFVLLDNSTGFSYGLILKKQVSPVFGLRGQLIRGQLKGKKENYTSGTPANLELEADFFEMNFNTSLDFVNLLWGYNSKRPLNIYGFFGIGVGNYQGLAKNYVTNVVFHSFGNGYGKGISGWMLEGLLTGGGGAKIRISNSFDICLETSLKFWNTDKFDGKVGGFKYDFHSYHSFGLSYNFGKSEKHRRNIIQEPKVVEVEPEPVKITPAEPEAPKIVEPVKTETKTEEPKSNILATPKPETQTFPDYEYKVQVMASKTPVDISYIQKRFNINEPIREDYDGVWYRYSVGSFKEYQKARESANKLNTVNKVEGAFVVGFKNGKRLNSVKELLNYDEKNNDKIYNNIVTNPTVLEGIFYRIQVIALAKKMLKQEEFKQRYQLDSELHEEYFNNLYIYLIGEERDKNNAVILRNHIRNSGIPDAFIVKYINGIRQTVK